jgi:HlyD family secretion protein
MSEDSENIIVNDALLKSNLADLLGGKTPMPNDEDDYLLSYNSNDNDTSNIQTEAVRDFLEEIPNWIIRWGMLVISFVLFAAFSISWFVHYPTVVNAEFRLTSENIPKPIIAKVDGRLEELSVKENQKVKKGEILGYIESTAKPDEILALEEQLIEIDDLLQKQAYNQIGNIDLNGFKNLGEVQNQFQNFQVVYVQITTLFLDGFYNKRRSLLETDITELERTNRKLEEQYKIYQRDMELAEKEFQMNQKLFSQKVIAPLEFYREESKLLAKKLPLKNIENAIINNNTLKNAKKTAILDLDNSILQQKGSFQQNLNTLRSAIESWKNRYLLISPTDGSIYFSGLLQEKQILNIGTEIMYVGTQNQEFFGEIRIPQTNFGKVKIGQKVLVKFQGYPFEEFGAVEGKIATIAQLPSLDNTTGQPSAFIATVKLPNGLKTNFNKQLSYKIGMTASAEIITEDLRLIERLFYQIRKIFVQH